MWPTFETAVWAYNAANVFLIISLAAGVIATIVVVWMGNVKEEYLTRELAGTNARAEEAKAASSRANAKAAELEKEAADARLETERIKEVVSWRTMPSESAATLARILPANPGSVNLRYTDGDPEALFLAIQVSQILNKANWTVAAGAVKPQHAIFFGIGLPDNSGADAKALRDAFSAANIPFSTGPLPKTGVGFSISTIQGAPTLMIGSRKPALP